MKTNWCPTDEAGRYVATEVNHMHEYKQSKNNKQCSTTLHIYRWPKKKILHTESYAEYKFLEN